MIAEKSNLNYKHLVGIVPATGMKTDFQFPWLPEMMPVTNNFSCLGASILRCAAFGCDSVWVVCYNHALPFFRETIGEKVQDPKYMNLPFKVNPYYHERHIPIYFVPLPFLEEKTQDTSAFSILYGTRCVKQLTSHFSKWARPTRYFVSFPFGMVSHNEFLRTRIKNRKDINIYYYQEKSVLDEEFLPFTFAKHHLIKIEKNYKKNKPKTLRETFWVMSRSEHNKIEVKNYYNVSTWNGMLDWFSSPGARKFKTPKKTYFPGGRWSEIAENRWTRDLYGKKEID